MAGIHRRKFLKISAAAAAAASCPSLATGMELKLGGADFHQSRTFRPRSRKNYLCTLCPWFDGGYTFAEEGKIKKCEGAPDHVATRGKFCAKGLASFLSVGDPDRILTPLKRVGPRGSGEWEEISWNAAIAEVAAKVTAALDDPDTIHLNEGGFKDGGPVRFLDTLGSNSLIRSRVPSIGNITRQTALEKTLGVKHAIPDVERTKYILNFGANILETAPPLAQRLTDGIVNNRLKMVTFDVRLSNTAGRSDEWVPVFPGSDGVVALAMANVIMKKGLANLEFINTYTNTTGAKLAQELAPYTPEMAEKASGVPAKTLTRIAIEFANSRPAVVYTHNGVSLHDNGIQGENACLLLAIITGNIENEGGFCLPRQYDIVPPQPAPEPAGSATLNLNFAFPVEVKEGARKVSVLFNHMSNPAYSAPASSLWREVLKDESLIPFLVDFSPFMSETAEFADIILPDVVAVERHDLGSAPTALWPWASMSYPGGKPRGKAKDVREVLKKIVAAIDPDGARGMKKYWGFKNAKKWVQLEAQATKGLGKRGYKKLKSKGTWPAYGKIDPANRKIVRRGVPLVPAYGAFKQAGFPTPSGKIEVAAPGWRPNARHAAMKENEFVLTTYKVAYHSLSLTTNMKYLAEMWHSNPLWLNKNVARKMGVRDGDLVRVISEAGYMVTKAWLTQGIHPQAIGISTSVGRTAYGRVAQADADKVESFAPETPEDLDIDDNLWWRDAGANPNDIIPIALDPASGLQAWNDTVVTVAKAAPGDRYGDVKVDNAKHIALYKKQLG